MIRNYFKIAYRNLIRNKFYSFINISGLAIGIACFILIVLFINDELSYDRFHANADRIYRAVEKIDSEQGQGEESSSNPFPFANAIANDYPHLVESSVRFFNLQAPTLTLQYKDKKINEKKIFFADSSVFNIFTFPLADGNEATALSKPNSIVLTKELARKYFGDENPIGKTLKFEGVLDLDVTGILENIPLQSHIHFDCLISFSTVSKLLGPNYNRNWIWNPCWTYLLLKPGIQAAELENQFPDFIKKYYPDFIKSQIRHYLQPLTNIHLESNLDYEIQPNSDKTSIYIFAAIGLFILLIACINFMNLATARSSKRAREVGIRKVLGAYRSQLIKQYIGESILISFIAIIISLVLVELFLPIFNNLSGKELALNSVTGSFIFPGIIVTGLIVGITAGIYPAFFLSSFQPLAVLKGSFNSGNKSKYFRKTLVIVQFTISITLIISTMVIYSQLNYLRTADLGFDKEQVIIIPTRPPMLSKFETIKNEFLKNNNVHQVAVMNEIIGSNHNTHEYNYEGMQEGKWVYFPSLIVNETFVETFKIKILQGRAFSKDIKTDDSLGVLINESMVRHLGWGTAKNAIGKQFYTPNGKERVIGVFQDFNFVSLLKPIGPFVLDMPSKRGRAFWTKFIAVRVNAENYKTTLTYMETIWNKFAPAYPFEYSFLDEKLNTLYKSQDNLGKLVGYFSVLAIFIACLGLFALAAYTSEQRTKEIGIRKVLGASVLNITSLLSKDFLTLVFISNIIAWPLSYFLMHNWLKNFAYKVDISPSIFIIAAIVAMGIALITITFQSVKAAVNNPINALKYE